MTRSEQAEANLILARSFVRGVLDATALHRFIVAIDDNANGYEIEVTATNEKDAIKTAWSQLTDRQRCTAASLEVVERIVA